MLYKSQEIAQNITNENRMFKYDKDMKEIIIYRGPQQKIKGDTFSLDLFAWALCESEEGTLTIIKLEMFLERAPPENWTHFPSRLGPNDSVNCYIFTDSLMCIFGQF